MRLCIFCGSSGGADPVFAMAATAAARKLARAGIGVVTGGGNVGLMGVVADTVLAEGGEVIGIMPRALVESEIAHQGLTEMHVVETMHERKMLMSQLSDGFIASPGGAGTLEEIFEQWTWAQLGIHAKPCAFHNVSGHYGPLKTMIETMVCNGFVSADHGAMIILEEDFDVLLQRVRDYDPPAPKWTDPSEEVRP